MNTETFYRADNHQLNNLQSQDEDKKTKQVEFHDKEMPDLKWNDLKESGGIKNIKGINVVKYFLKWLLSHHH